MMTDLDGRTAVALHLHTVLSCRVLQNLLLVEQFVVLVHIKCQFTTWGLDSHCARTVWTVHQGGVKSQSLESHHCVLKHTHTH